jgi:hypothetical protein
MNSKQQNQQQLKAATTMKTVNTTLLEKMAAEYSVPDYVTSPLVSSVLELNSIDLMIANRLREILSTAQRELNEIENSDWPNMYDNAINTQLLDTYYARRQQLLQDIQRQVWTFNKLCGVNVSQGLNVIDLYSANAVTK